MKKLYYVFLMFFFITVSYAQVIPFDSDQWELQGKETKTVDHFGTKSLYVKGGAAILKGSNFTNGIIEFDISFPEIRGFSGVFWRMVDDNNYEDFYVRHHLSGMPDANQYTPSFNGVSGWQLYHGADYSAPTEYFYDKWNHIKIVVSGRQGEVYINDMEKPQFVIQEMKRAVQSGKIGLKASGFVHAYFANFQYQAMDKPALKGEVKVADPIEPGTITDWQISSLIEGKKLDEMTTLSKEIKKDLSWETLTSENTGITNIARLRSRTKKLNTVFAKITINSSKAQIKKIDFGYSDNVRVFLNDQLLYSGTNTYVSRDYRYLGTVGNFDSVYLNLKKGKNEVFFAVTEFFGGWGIKAKMEDNEGLLTANIKMDTK